MQELYKNPMVYYILIPCLVLAWPAFMMLKYMPSIHNERDTWMGYVEDANDLIIEILTLDPERLNYAGKQGEAVEFEYNKALYDVANSLRIANDYTFRPGATTSGIQKKKMGDVTLDNINITQCSLFLSTLQMRWNGLECTKLGLTNKKTMKDRWDATMSFVYYY